jgi:hypothetical protein
MRPSGDIYDEFYRIPYETYWSKISEETGKPYMEKASIQNHFRILEEIKQRLDQVDLKKWEEYRNHTGIGK